MDVRTAVRQLGELINLTLSISPSKSCRLVFDETLIVDIDWPDGASNRVLLSSGVGVVPDDRKLEIYEILLSANAFGRDTADATLGVETGHGEIILHRAVQLDDLRFDAFVRILEEFNAAARAWTDRLAQLPAKPAGVEPFSHDFIRA